MNADELRGLDRHERAKLKRRRKALLSLNPSAYSKANWPNRVPHFKRFVNV